MQSATEILLVDDNNEFIRMALRRILGFEEDFEVIGDVFNAEEALSHVELNPLISLLLI